MTINDAIKHCYDVVDKNKCVSECAINDFVQNKARKCVNEHLQLAKWLEELRTYKEYVCDDCKRFGTSWCIYCVRGALDNYEPKEDKNE